MSVFIFVITSSFKLPQDQQLNQLNVPPSN